MKKKQTEVISKAVSGLCAGCGRECCGDWCGSLSCGTVIEAKAPAPIRSRRENLAAMVDPGHPPVSPVSSASLTNTAEHYFVQLKLLHSIAEEALHSAKLTSLPDFHVDAEPEGVRLDVGDLFYRMTPDQACALGTHLIVAAARYEVRAKVTSSQPRLHPAWIVHYIEKAFGEAAGLVPNRDEEMIR